jgi:hypothetical protein
MVLTVAGGRAGEAEAGALQLIVECDPQPVGFVNSVMAVLQANCPARAHERVEPDTGASVLIRYEDRREADCGRRAKLPSSRGLTQSLSGVARIEGRRYLTPSI